MAISHDRSSGGAARLRAHSRARAHLALRRRNRRRSPQPTPRSPHPAAPAPARSPSPQPPARSSQPAARSPQHRSPRLCASFPAPVDGTQLVAFAHGFSTPHMSWHSCAAPETGVPPAEAVCRHHLRTHAGLAAPDRRPEPTTPTLDLSRQIDPTRPTCHAYFPRQVERRPTRPRRSSPPVQPGSPAASASPPVSGRTVQTNHWKSGNTAWNWAAVAVSTRRTTARRSGAAASSMDR